MRKKLLFFVLAFALSVCALCLNACGGGVKDVELSFVVNGQTHTVTQTKSNETVELPAPPQVTGYEFGGWYWDNNVWDKPFNSNFSNVTASSEMNVYAKMNLINYGITYELNGGENNPLNPSTYTIKDSVTFKAPTKNGYAFNGWDVSLISIGTTGNKTVTASWTLENYAITYENVQGATNDNADSYTIESPTITLNSITRLGYEFEGWFIGEEKITEIESGSFGDKTLTAKWKVVTYNVNYYLDGGTNYNNPIKYAFDEEIILAASNKRGYEFKGWYTDAAFTNQITKIGLNTTGDLSLYAKFEIVSYAIEYIFDQNKVVENESASAYTVNEQITLSTPTVIDHYQFEGWYYDQEYSMPVTRITSGSVGDKVFYGKISPIKYNITYENTKNVQNDNPEYYTFESETITFVALEKDGYVFEGWDVSAIANGSSGHKTVTASWSLEVYDIIYVYDETAADFALGSAPELTYTVEDTVTLEDLICHTDGYTFNGWFDANDYVAQVTVIGGGQTGDRTVYAKLDANTFNVYIDGDIDTAVTQTAIEYGDGEYAIEIPDAREEYIFLGYADIDDVFYTDQNGNAVKAWDKDCDSTLYSKWEKVTYPITFITGDGASTIEPVRFAFGDGVDLTQYIPTKEGYSFNGWYLNESDETPYTITTMPNQELTLTAKWIEYALGEISYNQNKKAIKVSDQLTPELFSAECIDTDGKKVAITAIITSGEQTAGQTVTVKITATSGELSKDVTITNVKVYGTPTLTLLDTSKDYINVNNLIGSWFNASAVDTFGEQADITVRLEEGASAGEITNVYVDATDAAGNVTTEKVENVSVYDNPVITYDQDKIGISVSDNVNANLFSASAKDSFDNDLTLTVSIKSGTLTSTTTVTVEFSATDSKGHNTTFTKDYRVYGDFTISDTTITDIKEDTPITPEELKIEAEDVYRYKLEVSLSIKSGEQIAGQILVVTATAQDVAGNVATKDFSFSVYGTPTITYDRLGLNENQQADIAAPWTVTFDLNGVSGTAPAQQTVWRDSDLYLPENPTTSTRAFRGWFVNSQCTELFNFNKHQGKDITLYAGWEARSHYGYYLDFDEYNNTSDSAYTISTSSKTYVYFTAYNGGTYRLNFKVATGSYNYSVNYRIYNVTKDGSMISNGFTYSTEYVSYSFSASAGDVLYILFEKYSSYSNTVNFYVQGVQNQRLGGYTKSNHLNVSAKDSFGNNLKFSVSLKEGEFAVGNKVVYTITATDKVGNVATLDTAPIGVHSADNITFTYDASGVDKAKINSGGEEFNAVATDMFGNPCSIKIVEANGGNLIAGAVNSIKLVATDVAGNRMYSDVIENIKIYATPTVTANENYITASTDLDTFYSVKDSFEALLPVTVNVNGNQQEGELVTVTASATDVAGNQVEEVFVYWVSYDATFNDTDKTVTINRYYGEETVLEIPDKIGEYAVVGIAEGAFKDCTVTSVVIPDSVTAIGAGAFNGCSALESITLHYIGGSSQAGTASASTLFGYIFGTTEYSGGTLTQQNYSADGSETYYIPSSLTSVTILGGEILYGAFYNCAMLQTVTVIDDMTAYGANAFYGCEGLSAIYYMGTVGQWMNIDFANEHATPLYYAHRLFVYNTDKTAFIEVTELDLTDVNVIKKYSFAGGQYLTKVTFGDDLNSIGDYAFYNALGLTEINFNAREMTSLVSGNNVFYKAGASGTGITVNVGANVKKIPAYLFNPSANSPKITKVAFKENGVCATIEEYAFASCYNLKNINLPNTITTIGKSAFTGCSGLKEITLPSEITVINERVFSGCSGLTKIVIPDKVTTINSYAFDSCYDLKSITLGKGLTTIKSRAFYAISYLNEIIFNAEEMPDLNTGNDVFINVAQMSEGVAFKVGANVKRIPANLFYPNNNSTDSGPNITSIVFEENSVCESIGESAFVGCENLTTVTIPSSVTKIGSYAFWHCTSLTTVYFEEPTNWHRTTSSSYTDGTLTDMTVATDNAKFIRATYNNYYWYREDGV